MGKNIGVLSCQFEPYIGNRDKNLEKVDELIGQYGDKNIDLVLVPEFFTTGIPKDGFIPEEEKTSYTLDFMKNLAKKYKTNICCGSIIEKEYDKLYNTTYFIDRSGDVTGKYRKIHLFSYFGGNEHLSITKGDKIVVVEADFGVVGLSLCFDIRFPLLYNKLIKAGAEIIVCPNAWCIPKKMNDELTLKQEEIKAFTIARASENLVYFITSSLSGSIGSGLLGAGYSSIVSPRAEILAEANELNQAIYSEIDLSTVRKFKKEFPVYKID